MTRLGTAAIDRHQVRLLVVDRGGAIPRMVEGIGSALTRPRVSRWITQVAFTDLPGLLDPGDVVVVNDAATLPASLRGTTAGGAPIEVRLLPPVRSPRVDAVLFGAGDHTTPTERRPPPPAIAIGERLELGAIGARVVALAGRRATLELEPDDDALWQALYRAGRPVQYAHRAAPLPLWAVQTAYAGRPWASEMPSAGRPLTWELLLALRRRGVAIATLTHAAGLSATGDPALDATLPWPEPYEIPPRTAALVAAARRTGGRVIAVGTTVVRALESAAATGAVVAGPGLATLVITPDHRLRVVDGILSGLHGPEESHHRLLGAFVAPVTLAAALDIAAAAGLQGHASATP